MRYRHCFLVNAPLDVVADFHAQSASMAAITPPPVAVQVRRAPDRLQDGDEMDFTLWLGPVAAHWLARIEEVSRHGFTDRQLRGPFKHWTHHHKFLAVNETTTAVVDEIELGLHPRFLWGLVGFGMWISLPLLFLYRGWKTQRLIAGRWGIERLAVK